MSNVTNINDASSEARSKMIKEKGYDKDTREVILKKDELLTLKAIPYVETHIKGKPVYVKTSGNGDFTPITKTALIDAFAHMVVEPDGGFKFKPLMEVWLEWKDRPRCSKGVTFDMSEPTGVCLGKHYNIWRGFGVKPVSGDERGAWRLFENHITDVLADGDTRLAKYIMDWCAYGIQNPSEPVGVALVLKGGKGTGKGVFGSLMCKIWGEHSFHVTNPTHLTGRFNGHLATKPFVFSDEAVYVGDKKGERVLKGLITERNTVCEKKGYEAFQVKTAFKILMASNDDYVVPASNDERRYCIAGVSDKRVGDTAYFKALLSAFDSDEGCGAIFHMLLNRDLTNVNIREFPVNKELLEEKEEGLNSVARFMLDCAERGALPLNDSQSLCIVQGKGSIVQGKGSIVQGKGSIVQGLHGDVLRTNEFKAYELYDAYVRWYKVNLNTHYGLSTQTAFGRYLVKCGFEKKRKEQGIVYHLDSPQTIIAKVRRYERLDVLDTLPLLDVS